MQQNRQRKLSPFPFLFSAARVLPYEGYRKNPRELNSQVTQVLTWLSRMQLGRIQFRRGEIWDLAIQLLSRGLSWNYVMIHNCVIHSQCLRKWRSARRAPRQTRLATVSYIMPRFLSSCLYPCVVMTTVFMKGILRQCNCVTGIRPVPSISIF